MSFRGIAVDMRPRLRVLRIGVRFDLDRDRSAEIRAGEFDDPTEWVDGLAAAAAGREVFVTARFFAVYDDLPERSFGGTHSWITVSTQRDVTDDLVRQAENVHADGWPTELADMRIAGWDLERADFHPVEAVVEVAPDLLDRIVVSTARATTGRPSWRLEPVVRLG